MILFPLALTTTCLMALILSIIDLADRRLREDYPKEFRTALLVATFSISGALVGLRALFGS